MRAMCLGNCGCPVSAQHLNCAYTGPLGAIVSNKVLFLLDCESSNYNLYFIEPHFMGGKILGNRPAHIINSVNENPQRRDSGFRHN